ncbi:MAG: hypothetical protein AAF443_01810 [Chlamydiota bacterium]
MAAIVTPARAGIGLMLAGLALSPVKEKLSLNGYYHYHLYRTEAEAKRQKKMKFLSGKKHFNVNCYDVYKKDDDLLRWERVATIATMASGLFLYIGCSNISLFLAVANFFLTRAVAHYKTGKSEVICESNKCVPTDEQASHHYVEENVMKNKSPAYLNAHAIAAFFTCYVCLAA